MARADRLERIDIRREELEADYRATLIAALERVAGGVWGLFGHNQDRAARAKYAAVVAELDDKGAEIDDLRRQLGLAPFDLHRDFVASRGPVRSDQVGEPKQARAWLDRLAAD